MNDDLLIQKYLDGSLSHEENQLLSQRLREDPAMRDQLRSIAEHAVAFGDMARMLRATEAESNPVNPSSGGSSRSARFSSWLALAASVALLAASAWFFLQSASPQAPVLTLVESTGTVSWAHGEPIQPGGSLPAGTLETVGEDSSALLQFQDGTLITLHGETELSFSEENQKILSLTRGTLSAEVKPQRNGHPMLIRTPSAVAEVVGTVFDLSARSEDTLLKVDEGLVKLKRLADGSQIEVSANRSAVASLDANTSLDMASTPEPLTDWTFDFTKKAPPRDWRGIARDGVMNASPYVARKLPDGRIITHHGVSVRTSMLEKPLRLLATESSVIRYRLRLDKPTSLQLMLLTNQPEGGFGGNFECKISENDLRPDAEGWCDIAIPIRRYAPVNSHPHIRKQHPTAAGNIITSAIVNTFGADRKLAVARFELSSRP
ncbi:FecR domain-containing protein [Prosthecobacter sp.]|uniref:FecR domain-containing protein n=1 Tax=Prosthecobacter sp. TaxID=1965333 RepID=UPI00378524F0